MVRWGALGNEASRVVGPEFTPSEQMDEPYQKMRNVCVSTGAASAALVALQVYKAERSGDYANGGPWWDYVDEAIEALMQSERVA